MTKPTVFSLFCGGGGKTQGAINAGYEPVGAIDYWQTAIDYYKINVSPIAECLDLLTHTQVCSSPIDLLMASPPCVNYSRAKVGAAETKEDSRLSNVVYEFARAHKPKAIIIENVRAYGRSESCKMLVSCLEAIGYKTTQEIINAADLGCPQSRERLIIRAVDPEKAELKPIALTHSKNGKVGLLPWNGWYNAIADLIPDLPDSKLTDRQVAAVIKAGGDRQLIQRIGYYNGNPRSWDESEPIGTVRAALATDRLGGNRSKFLDCIANGLTKNITPRALQRLQGLPDSWVLPERLSDAVRIIGNSVVPIVAQAACESIVYP